MVNRSTLLCLLTIILLATSAFAKTETFVNPFTGKTETYETFDRQDSPSRDDSEPTQKTETQYLEEFSAKAATGDYQAQRNLAWLYSTSTDPFISNKLLGCAWYKLILLSGSPKIGDGDIGNVETYCGRLSPEQQAVTEQQALRLYQDIYAK